MKGYIVGYLDSWANDRSNIIVGYFTMWPKMLNAIKTIERENIEKYSNLRSVYAVEIDINKINNVKTTMNWIENYPHYTVRTEFGKTLMSGCGKDIHIDLYEKPTRSGPPGRSRPSS